MLAALPDTMPSCREPHSASQATLRLTELRHATSVPSPGGGPSLRRHASSIAQHVGMAVPRFSHDTRSCRSVGSTVGHDAMLTGDFCSHSGNAETE